jgi:hypothetical protein
LACTKKIYLKKLWEKFTIPSSSGIANLGWLNANFSFNYINYTKHIQFRLLRVLNRDLIEPGKGFAPTLRKK